MAHDKTLPLPLEPNPPRAAFRLRIKALGISISQFAKLWGIEVQTIYGWTIRSGDKYPPPYAWRMLRLTELDPSILRTLALMPVGRKEHQ
jgi:DNA-binding transcriptional regulator YiaG